MPRTTQLRLTSAALLTATIISSTTRLQQTYADSVDRAAWLQEAKWGTMTHYLSDWLVKEKGGRGEVLEPASRVVEGPMTPAKWNKLVDQFDVERFADQLKSVGTGYHIMTVGQTSGYYLSPNATYDRIIGRDQADSRFPDRDVIHEVGRALQRRGIRFIVYIPIEEPLRGDKEASRRLRPKGQPDAHGGTISGERAGRIFIHNWNQILEEYANRWGDTVDGWWFDGCWQGKMSYTDEPNWGTIIRTLRKANPNVIVSFNHQHRGLRDLPPPPEDFFAGETNNPQNFLSMSAVREDGAVSQMLTYLGYTWYFGNRPRFDTETAKNITRNVTRYGGAITWDIAITKEGELLDSYIPVLKAINEAAHEDLWATWEKETGGQTKPRGNLAYRKPAYLTSNHEGKNDHHGLFTKLLPANANRHFAANGVDNDLSTKAQASNEWAWGYAVDLIKPFRIGHIDIGFGEDTYATEYKVQTSLDGLHWETVHHETRADGAPKRLRLKRPVETRWIRVRSFKPDGEGQPGTQMAITEIHAYEER